MSREIVYVKFGPGVMVGGQSLEQWSSKAGTTSELQQKTSVREDQQGNVWLKWSGGSAEVCEYDHKVPLHNVLQVTYGPEKPAPVAQPGKGK